MENSTVTAQNLARVIDNLSVFTPMRPALRDAREDIVTVHGRERRRSAARVFDIIVEGLRASVGDDQVKELLYVHGAWTAWVGTF